MAPEHKNSPLMIAPAKSMIYKDPLGAVLIMSPWNYPVNLAIVPLVGAIAGGNTVLLKVSRHSAATAELLSRLLPKYLDPATFRVEGRGGASFITEVIKHHWDHIFFTGSVSVGRIVARAAAEWLTPVTLELGGKNPCFVDRDVDVKLAAKRIGWGKFWNSGQTCVAPDYILTFEDMVKPLVDGLQAYVRKAYGEDPQKSECFPRIISSDHAVRLAKLFSDGEVAFGGKSDPADKYVEPTVILNPKPNSVLLTDEVFGPVLPIVVVKSVEEALQYINDRPTALSMYCFSRNRQVEEEFLTKTRSGNAMTNDVIVHFTNAEIPFGGCGESGCGAYHGHLTFDTFVHRKGVVRSVTSTALDIPLRYPPYPNKDGWLFWGIDKLAKMNPNSPI